MCSDGLCPGEEMAGIGTQWTLTCSLGMSTIAVGPSTCHTRLVELCPGPPSYPHLGTTSTASPCPSSPTIPPPTTPSLLGPHPQRGLPCPLPLQAEAHPLVSSLSFCGSLAPNSSQRFYWHDCSLTPRLTLSSGQCLCFIHHLYLSSQRCFSTC